MSTHKVGKKRRKRLVDIEDEDDEDGLSDQSSGSLHWSSPSQTEYEFDSEGEEYIPTGRNAKRALKSKKYEEWVLWVADRTVLYRTDLHVFVCYHQYCFPTIEQKDEELEEQDKPCLKCGKNDHPEMV